MPRDGALILSDVLGPTLSIVCEPCGRHETYNVARLMERHVAIAEGALGQYPRSVQGGIRKAGPIIQLDEERLGLLRISAVADKRRGRP
jgi:hypothetical protein